MSAPVNDNFINAIILNYESGSTTGTNISASGESGEPTNNGRTVWYEWMAPFNYGMSFRTTANISMAELSNPFATVLQLFKETSGHITASVVTDLTEVTYTKPQTFKTHYANWELGSQVVFDALQGYTYYIRVDGVNGCQGNFPLTWNQFFPLQLAPCGQCTPYDVFGFTCQGSAQPGVLAENTVEFGGTSGSGSIVGSGSSYPAGVYTVLYCGGAFAVGPPYGWTVCLDPDDTGASYMTYFVNYQTGSAISKSYFTNNNPGTNINYNSQIAAQNAFLCLNTTFRQDGTGNGHISITMNDTFFPDNSNGNPNPTWGLYRLIPNLSFVSACSSWVIPNTSAGATFTVANENIADWVGVSATLDTSGGISGANSTSGSTMSHLSNHTFTLLFNCSNESPVATLRLSCIDWAADELFTINLSPLMTSNYVIAAESSGVCGFNYLLLTSVKLSNAGYWNTSGTAVVSIDSGLSIFGDVGPPTHLPDCTHLVSSISKGISVGCSNSTNIFPELLYIKCPSVATTASLNISYTDQSQTYTFSQSINVPT